MHTHKCQQCKTDFTPLRGAKGLCCSHKCMLEAKSAHWDTLRKCLECHASLGITGAASGRLLNVHKAKVCRIKKRYGIKAMTNSEAQTASKKYKPWTTWWGGKPNAEAWLSEYSGRFVEWGLVGHQGFSVYQLMTPKQKAAKNKQNEACRRRRRATDPAQKAYANMRKRIGEFLSLARGKGDHRFAKVCGCSYEFFKAHIEAQWEGWMGWHNYGQGKGRRWHIDHIIPCAVFDHGDAEQVETCWHYSNLRPLGAFENIKKSDNWGWGDIQRVIANLDHPPLAIILDNPPPRGYGSSRKTFTGSENLITLPIN